VLSGGSSVGDRDLLVDAVRERGEVLFHGIAVKPGKPTLLARLGSTLLLGMPGNPTSCLSNAYILLIPLLRAMARLPPWRPETREARLARPVRNASGRHTFFTVRLEDGLAVPAFKGSGDITSLAHADGYIEIPADVESLPADAAVTVTMF
jgi:molybdopterin biosynthesis enzyme